MSGLVAKVAFTATRGVPSASSAEVYRIWPLLFTAVPVWQFWQLGSLSQPVRPGSPTALMGPWQFWHCMAMVPSEATEFPMTPRRQRVVEPGWQR